MLVENVHTLVTGLESAGGDAVPQHMTGGPRDATAKWWSLEMADMGRQLIASKASPRLRLTALMTASVLIGRSHHYTIQELRALPRRCQRGFNPYRQSYRQDPHPHPIDPY